MLSDALNIPFPRNRYARFEECILHGHYLYHKNFGKMVCVMRDGRDVMVSAYYHFLFEHDLNPSFAVKKWRNLIKFSDYDDIHKNLPAFIDYMFTSYKVAGQLTTWNDFVNSYRRDDVHIVTYENLLKDPVSELQQVMKYLDRIQIDNDRLRDTVNKFSFKNMSKRNPGDENTKSFLRKGIAGDWKNKFSAEARKVFDNYAGKELIKMGSENNSNWAFV